MDGVIVDTEPLNAQHQHEFLARLGVEPKDLNTSIQGLNSQAIWSLYREEYSLEQDIDELITQARQSYLSFLETLDHIPEIPGASQFIEYLVSLRCRLAIASSANPKRIELILDKLRLRKYFQVIISGDSTPRSKPAPDMFLLAAEKLGARPSDCIVIEDATNGVQAAKAAGMICIGYAGSDHNTDDLSEADIIINDFTEITNQL